MSEPAADLFFGGKLRLAQPDRGHRAGTDAALLVAAAGEAERVVDLGSGVGAVGLGLLALGRAGRAVLVEREAEVAALARANIALNGLAERAVVVEADVTGRAAALRRGGTSGRRGRSRGLQSALQHAGPAPRLTG